MNSHSLQGLSGTSRREEVDIPPIIASSILSKELADVCLVVMLERVKSKIGVYVA